MPTGDYSQNGPSTSNILLDHIRTLRDPLPSETFLDTSPVEAPSSYDRRFGSVESASVGGGNSASSSKSPSSPLPPQSSKTSFPPNGADANRQHAPSAELRSQTSNHRLPRPAAFTALSPEELGRSPKERLQAYLSPAAASPSSTSAQPLNSRASPAEPMRSSSDSAVTANTTPIRKTSSPIPPTTIMETTSTVDTSNAIMTSTKSHRNPSLDSGNSSISSTASGPSSSIRPAVTNTYSPVIPEDSAASDTDAASFIAAAGGSAETAVQNLLRERQALTSRNEQLWKLVEKQRTMILNLNKDLEKTVKDRERYRKRCHEKEKEVSDLLSNSEHHISTNSASLGTSTSQSVDASQKEMVQKSRHTKEPSMDSLLSIPHPQVPASSSMVSDSMGMPSISSTANTSQARSTSGQLPLRNIDISTANSKPSDVPNTTTPSSLHTKSPTSVGSPGEGKRKAPPKPLNLDKPVQPSSSQTADEAVESGSDYDDPSPPVERGRRKTREEDDRLREVAYVEEQQRSKSGKGKGSTSKSKSKQPAEAATAQPDVGQVQTQTSQQPSVFPVSMNNASGLPMSPRGAVLGALQSPMQPPPASISSTLFQNSRSAAPPAPPSTSQTISAPLKSPGLPLKSPGLPMSPRPGDRPMNAPNPRQLVSNGPGPMSPRSAMVLSPRAPRQPIPLPQDAPLGITSPHVTRTEHLVPPQVVEHAPPVSQNEVGHNRKVSRDEDDPTNVGEIFRGFASDQYPDLLLPPNALPLVEVKVYSARLRPSRTSYLTGRYGEEESVFTLAVHSRTDSEQLWRLEKTPLSLSTLENTFRRIPELSAKVPDKNHFGGHAPVRVDGRRIALYQYFDAILNTPLDDVSAYALCEYLSTDAIGPKIALPMSSTIPEEKRRKEGYLTKKGKQLGGWKARYFILDGSELRYFEGPSGGHLGNIKLSQAQIARQTGEDTSEDAEYRHAFMILEPKRKDSTSLNRHVLCAESDEERDSWVNALMAYVEPTDNLSSRPSISSDAAKTLKPQSGHSATPSIQSISYDQTVASGVANHHNEAPSPEDMASEFGTPSIHTSPERPNISAPVAGGPIQNAQAWGNKSPALKDGEAKKRNIFGFRSRNSEDTSHPQISSPQLQSSPSSARDSPASGFQTLYTTGNHNGRAIFGIPLSEAADFFPPQGIDVCLPSPVYRCIEFLEAKNAFIEEGIFRMSGSNTVIKQIRERFNSEGDVRLIDNLSYDIHAVASVLKLYLRELPESVLTRDLHLDFLKVLDTDDKRHRTEAINVLAHRLPEANFELLAALTRFLIAIVNNSDVNKMNVRNVGIVFSPTLNIPAPLISLLLTDHDSIFGRAVDPSSSPVIANMDSASTSASPTSATTPVSMDDLRSPRKQMFTDLATPAPNQTSFGPQIHGDAFYQQQMQPQHQTQFNKSDFDIGFEPMSQRPAMDPQANNSAPPPAQHPYRGIPAPVTRMQAPDPGAGGFGSLNAALASGPSQPKSS